MAYDMSWIKSGLTKQGKTKSGLAAALGRAPSAVTSLLQGTRELKAGEVEVVAKYLGVEPPKALTDEAPDGGSVSLAPTGVRVRVAGTVEAGAFREFTDWNQDEPEYVSADPEKRWPDARLVAMRVAGDSMNALKPIPIFDGATIVCVDYEDIADQHPMRTGMVVVLQRVAMGGHIREWSVKQIEVQDDHYVFHPRSTNQKHKPIVVTTDFQADDGMEVSVLALVRDISNRWPD